MDSKNSGMQLTHYPLVGEMKTPGSATHSLGPRANRASYTFIYQEFSHQYQQLQTRTAAHTLRKTRYYFSLFFRTCEQQLCDNTNLNVLVFSFCHRTHPGHRWLLGRVVGSIFGRLPTGLLGLFVIGAVISTTNRLDSS